MGGDHCAIVTCPANNTNNRGLTFHKLPAQGGNDEWRNQPIQKINRIDKGFNVRTAHISHHFRDSLLSSWYEFCDNLHVIHPDNFALINHLNSTGP